MPNWCDTTYKAVGTKEQVKKFYDLAMRSWKERSEKHSKADSGWLGTFVDILDGPDGAYARGWMQDEPYLRDDFEGEDYAECTIYCETAWGEPDGWRHFIESQIDGLKLFYLAIEPGCQVYISNDDEYADKYYVDNLNDGTDILSEEGTIKYVNNFFGQHFTTIDECIDFAGEHRDDDGDADLWINQIEIYDD